MGAKSAVVLIAILPALFAVFFALITPSLELRQSLAILGFYIILGAVLVWALNRVLNSLT